MRNSSRDYSVYSISSNYNQPNQCPTSNINPADHSLNYFVSIKLEAYFISTTATTLTNATTIAYFVSANPTTSLIHFSGSQAKTMNSTTIYFVSALSETTCK